MYEVVLASEDAGTSLETKSLDRAVVSAGSLYPAGSTIDWFSLRS